MEWESRNILPLSAKSRYQPRRAFTRGHYRGLMGHEDGLDFSEIKKMIVDLLIF